MVKKKGERQRRRKSLKIIQEMLVRGVQREQGERRGAREEGIQKKKVKENVLKVREKKWCERNSEKGDRDEKKPKAKTKKGERRHQSRSSTGDEEKARANT